MEITRIQALCFDVDGTLRDTDDQMVRRITQYLNPVSFLFENRNPQPFARRFVMSTEDPATALLSFLDRIHLDATMDHFHNLLYRFNRNNTGHDFPIIEGVEQMLSTLSKRYPLAVITARGERGTLAFLDHFGLTPYFQAIATGRTCKYTKPSPDPVIWSAGQLGVNPEACLMIGDTTVDMHAGKAAGAQTAGVLCGFGEEEELLDAGADIILQTTAELTGFL